jgi:hypothetical protein
LILEGDASSKSHFTGSSVAFAATSSAPAGSASDPDAALAPGKTLSCPSASARAITSALARSHRGRALRRGRSSKRSRSADPPELEPCPRQLAEHLGSTGAHPRSCAVQGAKPGAERAKLLRREELIDSADCARPRCPEARQTNQGQYGSLSTSACASGVDIPAIGWIAVSSRS